MSNYDKITEISARIEEKNLSEKKVKQKTFLDYVALFFATFGVGYLPLAPGTFGSIVGVLIYLSVSLFEAHSGIILSDKNWSFEQISALFSAANLFALTLFCLLGIWASNRAVLIFGDKDPQKVVVDEVLGQLIVFLFIPFGLSWHFVLAGFLLFRLFDIWKPYPIDSLQNLPAGIGVCADDFVAGIYGGICLSIIYAVYLIF